MITLTTSRRCVREVKDYFFSYINLYKQTRLNNVAHHDGTSEEFLSAVVINCLLTEIELLFNKKLLNTTGPTINFKFTDAQGIVWYKTLLALPLRPDQDYFLMIRNEWVYILDKQIIAANLVTVLPKKAAANWEADDWD